ncbi:serine protease snake-like [Drosophila gunungcola]|uniref:Peptidase S1 domain-containing protein n=1 Tax=Drosophila gunungcola TaxID=103775 RepID=A0A9P9YXI9_9MUSC|nr:serine protease snake-like [Drosophila gunungcola]KAI8044937.1 hypothetical protein M5D96_001113 [Drosophila gunungcola]
MQSNEHNISLWILSLLILSVSGLNIWRGEEKRFYYVYGGKLAELNEFRPTAQLGFRQTAMDETTWFCGGVYIAPLAILTAAHCFYSEEGAVNVVRLNDRGNAYEVLETKEHPNFRFPVLYNDIGIVRLRKDLPDTPFVYPACLPFINGGMFDYFTAVGWGQTEATALLQPRELIKVELQNFEDRCPSIYEPSDQLPEGYKNESQLCVGSADHKDTCYGDSGGPLLTNQFEMNCRYQVVGITSVGIACGIPNVPSVYTRVHFFLDWIQKELSEELLQAAISAISHHYHSRHDLSKY